MFDFKFEGKWENIKYRFTAFEGLQSRMGSYTSMDKKSLSDGTVNMNITASLDHIEPTKEQIQTIDWISYNGDLVKKSIYKAVREYYVEVKKLYGFDSEDTDQKEWFPELNSITDLGKAMGVGNLTIMLIEKDGLCVYNLECGCTWDEEHGLGLEMFKDEVLNIGDAGSCIGGGTTILTPIKEKQVDKQTAIAMHHERMKIWERNPNDSRIRIEEPKYYTTRHPTYNKLNPSQEYANNEYSRLLIYGGYSEKFERGIKEGIVQINIEILNITIAYCRVKILEIIKLHKPEIIPSINEVDTKGLTSLDKVYNKLARKNSYNREHLSQIDELIEWLKINRAKLGNDL